MKFLDEAKIYLKSGDGGGGCVSFRREKFVSHGGPDGGDGGKGGDIIFKCVPALNTLIDYRYTQHFKAKGGESGKGRNKSGANAPNIILKVPVGTQIFDEQNNELIYDFTEIDTEFRIMKGGDGGFGNARFKSSTNQAPEYSTPGWSGEEKWVWLKLKLISDIGLVGLPNVGKSTFLSIVSSAKPKIADYPFTTLRPQLGVVRIENSEFVIADIPGLIEGAHLGRGLGDKFLKHIERCKLILHLIDISDENYISNYKIIRDELENYSEILSSKSEIIVLNKIDLLSEEEIQDRKSKMEKMLNKKIFIISSATKYNTRELTYNLLEILRPNNEEEW